MSNPFIVKRTSLELFVKEQILGPGAFNKRFFLLKKWESNEFNGNLLANCAASDNVNEVIGEVPAYQYSSGILFPIALTVDEIDIEKDKLDDDGEGNDLDQALVKADDVDFSDDHNDSVSSKNQNYPNTCGLSFAIDLTTKIEKDISIQIDFRTYQKVKQKSCQENQLGYWISKNQSEITEIFTTYFEGIFEVITKDNNVFICLTQNTNINEYLYSLDYVNLEKFMKERLLPEIEKYFPGQDFHKTTVKEYDSVTYEFTTLYEDSLTDEIGKLLKIEPGNYNTYKSLISHIELFSQVKAIVNELKTIYRKSSRKNFPTPIWESQSFSKHIVLPEFELGKRIQRGMLPIDGFNDLVLNYQFLRNSAAIYVKLILVNKGIINLKADEPPQLNKKDGANEKSFFGVRLKVNEVIQGTFLPYNPPNLLEIDEEESFSKLIYRSYKDYSEGYNTSVNWGNCSDNIELKYVTTEFIPEQETPNVDFKPSELIDGNIVELIDENVLSIRSLSTLSDHSDASVLESLIDFIDAYKTWIDKKRVQLNEEQGIFLGKHLLEKQLDGCELDYKRLSRNIKLLSNDEKAISAFRTMNTAMFMQLHHSISVKALKHNIGESAFVPPDNNENYYRNLVLKTEYKWRSFQLAFIILNIDAFVQPDVNDRTVKDVFGSGWPERNELADLVWFPTGGGKTEAYLGIIAFTIAYRRFVKGDVLGKGTTVLMRYTLRLLTLQQFQRATMLICALEAIRKDSFNLPHKCTLGDSRITIGLFVGKGSLPNTWEQMNGELQKIIGQLRDHKKVSTNMPHTECPWCGGSLFVNSNLDNIEPKNNDRYGINDMLKIMCNTEGCTYHYRRPNENKCLPLRLFDEDIYKNPPTLLFGTVDKFAALANKVATHAGGRNQDSRRLLGKGHNYNCLPPELIIQDELHLLLGPLGSAVGLFEKGIDELCTYTENGKRIRPKVITSTATTRNTDKQIFALFHRRSEIFPKQGISCDDSFFAYYKRDDENPSNYSSNRKYVGLLPIGKTQVWMQLRLASICLAHRLKFLIDNFSNDEIFEKPENFREYEKVFDYYQTVLSYFNSLKEVGKTQSQLNHYLPGDLGLVIKNTTIWSFCNKFIRNGNEVDYSELTGRLSGEEVKTNLSKIESHWLVSKQESPPEFVISTNMISVGIDVSRFNTMIINSMPRNTAEYIQASSRVARDKEGIVFTVHHPFRSRDISHYQKFKEFHEKFYSYVEPISITPFATKALERYFAMFLTVMIRHSQTLFLSDNESARNVTLLNINEIRDEVLSYIAEIKEDADKLNLYLKERTTGVSLNIDGIIGDEEVREIELKLDDLLVGRWLDRIKGQDPTLDLNFRADISHKSLFRPRNAASIDNNWNVKESLREIAPSIVIKTVQQ